MSLGRFEYFASDNDQENFFSLIDEAIQLKITEISFDKRVGPRLFEGFIDFLDFIRGDASPIERQCGYYACANPEKLQSTDNIYSDYLVSYNLILNPDVLTLNYGEQLDHDRLLMSRIGRSNESPESKNLLSRIKRMAKRVDGEGTMTTSGEFVFSDAKIFAEKGGRLVRTPEAISLYDARLMP